MYMAMAPTIQPAKNIATGLVCSIPPLSQNRPRTMATAIPQLTNGFMMYPPKKLFFYRPIRVPIVDNLLKTIKPLSGTKEPFRPIAQPFAFKKEMKTVSRKKARALRPRLSKSR